MKKIVNVFIDGVHTSVYDYHIPLLVDLDHEVHMSCFPSYLTEEERVAEAEEWEKKLKEESNSKESIFTKIVEVLAEMPELYGYALGVIATLSSIIAMVINYHFYGRLYERFHNKK